MALGQLIFESDVHFDPATDDAVIWADGDGGSRFRLVITRGFLISVGLKKRFDHAGARALIDKFRGAFERFAQEAYDQGDHELVF